MFSYDVSFCLLPILLVSICLAEPVKGAPRKVVFDTDFAMPPQDDALALMLALNSPELEIVGISTVAGNRSQEQALVDVLRLLEIAGRTDLPVYAGADMPLVHEVSEFAVKSHGEWYSNEPPEVPPGGFPSKKAEEKGAVDFLLQESRLHSGELSIIALGPLTNIAMAIRQDPGFEERIGKVFIMGGAIACLPEAAGKITPNAMFN